MDQSIPENDVSMNYRISMFVTFYGESLSTPNVFTLFLKKYINIKCIII